jgi:hypothetical protein
LIALLRALAGAVLAGLAMTLMIAASFDPRCPAADPARCHQIARQGLVEIAKDRP